MEQKTLTTLKELRIGDSFIFDKGDKMQPWRVTARADRKGRVAINKWDDRGHWIDKYDTLKKENTRVLFLRHTVPVPGEECYLDDLKEGDVFFRPDDIIHEYVVQRRGNMFFDVRRTDEAAPQKGGRFAKVIFVRHNACGFLLRRYEGE